MAGGCLLRVNYRLSPMRPARAAVTIYPIDSRGVTVNDQSLSASLPPPSISGGVRTASGEPMGSQVGFPRAMGRGSLVPGVNTRLYNVVASQHRNISRIEPEESSVAITTFVAQQPKRLTTKAPITYSDTTLGRSFQYEFSQNPGQDPAARTQNPFAHRIIGIEDAIVTAPIGQPAQKVVNALLSSFQSSEIKTHLSSFFPDRFSRKPCRFAFLVEPKGPGFASQLRWQISRRNRSRHCKFRRTRRASGPHREGLSVELY